MARVLAEGTGAARAAVWVRTGEVLHEAASWPASTPRDPVFLHPGQFIPRIDRPQRFVPERHQGDLLGALTVEKRAGERLSPVAVGELLESLSGHLRPALPVSQALDLYVAWTLPEVYRTLVLERSWSPSSYERWLGELLVRELVAS